MERVTRMRAKLDHRWSGDRMSEYIDGNLSSRKRRRLERHTDICPECRRALRKLAVVVWELRGLRRAGRPGLAPKVVQRIRGESRARSSPPAGRRS